jgi:hypothetical protein
MARIRSIKPEFFLDEELAEVSMETRLAFIGLWTLADKKGRLEDRPKRIKAELFPYEEANVEKSIRDLDEAGFIQRYEVNGRPYLQIRNFEKHQRPHPKEGESEIPEPPSREKKRQAVKRNGKPDSSGNLEILGVMESHAPPGKEILDLGREGDLGSGNGMMVDADAPPIARKLSPAQMLAAELAEARRKKLPGVADETSLSPAALNKQVGPLLVTPGADAIRRAWSLFLEDSWARGLTPPFPLNAFLSDKKLPALLEKVSGSNAGLEPKKCTPYRHGIDPDPYPDPGEATHG